LDRLDDQSKGRIDRTKSGRACPATEDQRPGGCQAIDVMPWWGAAELGV
jgi:hypothetical protein